MKEFKVVAFPRNKIYPGIISSPHFEKLENFLNEKSLEGWDIVSVASNECVSNFAGNIIITMQREKNERI